MIVVFGIIIPEDGHMADDLVDKECKKCNNLKSLKEFHSHINRYNTKVYSSSCMLCRHEIATTWNKKNRTKHTAHQAKWRSLHKEIDIQRSKDRFKRLDHRIKSRLRSRLRDAIKNNQKIGSAIGDLGCSIHELKVHLESQFKPGMTWENWSVHGWHLDHIKPLCSFDLEKEEEFQAACHYSNLQPLWAKDNLSKSGKAI